jgi:hypothetical protein
MPEQHVLRAAKAMLAVGVSALILVMLSRPACAITPEDDQVQKARDRGVKYLLNIPQGALGAGGGSSPGAELGARCLAAVALVKCDVDKNHAVVRQALNELKANIRSGAITQGYESVYNLGVGIVLCSAVGDKDTAQAALRQLLTFQRSTGGFASTVGSAGGDTSMTQYAVLGMWEATQLGIGVPAQAWQGVANWLIQTQGGDGTFQYNPTVGIPMGMTTSASHSMTAAGLGSLYICGNHIRIRNGKEKEPGGKKARQDDVPSVLTPVGGQKKEAEKENPGAGRITIDMGRVQAGMTRGDAWFAKNFKVSPDSWPFYYLYALERYQAFREKWEGESTAEPDWYNQGAAHLLQAQTADGSWNGDHSQSVSTSFALLFLIRGTKKSLKVEEKAGGTLLSGSGLPSDLSNIRIKDGKIAVKALAGPAGDLLEIMEKPDDPRFLEAIEGFGELVIKADDIMLSPHLVRLKKLAKSGSAEARAGAVIALGKSRDLDYVPTLIYALEDEDERVMKAAWDGLKFVSRRFDSFGLSSDFKGDEKERSLAKAKAIERWKEWYRTVRPDANFDE